jgi:hypothetical protein
MRSISVGSSPSRLPIAIGTLVLAVLVAALASAPAHAGKRVDGFVGASGAGTTEGLFTGTRDVATNETTGDVYVVEANNARVQRFDSGGDFELMWGSGVDDGAAAAQTCTSGCQAGVAGTGAGMFSTPQGIAINQTTGHVYVRDSGNRRVQEFTANGAFVRAWGFGVATGASAFEICTSGCLAGLAGAGIGQFGTSAVASNGIDVNQADGDVYVVDPASTGRRILRFNSDGTLDANPVIGSSAQFNTNQPLYVAVSAAGVVYASDTTGATNRIMRFDTTTSTFGTPIGTPPLLAAATRGLEIDHDNGRLLVVRDPASPATAETVIEEVNVATDTVVDTHGVGDALTGTANGFGMDTTNERLYLTYSGVVGGGNGYQGYFALDADGASPPAVTVSPPSAVGSHGATLNATVDPDGVATYHFEYNKTGQESGWIQAGPETTASGGDPATVSAVATGLEANAFYRVRIVATKPTGGATNLTATSAELTFLTDTVPPEATTLPAAQISESGATLRGRVNANNLPTTYRFEYGTTTAYGRQAPVEDGSAGSSGVEVALSDHVEGLLSNVTYHYRLVATNAQGTTPGADRTLKTRIAVEPPPGRAYEMVTPANKNNRITSYFRDEEGIPDGRPGVPSPDGESVYYSVNHGILDPDSGTAFPNAKDDVVIHRGTTGWTTKSVHDIQSQVGATGATTELIGSSADFSVQSWRHDAYLFPSGSKVGTKILDDDGGFADSGWYDWLPDPSLNGGFANSSDSALIDGEGERILRWGVYHGLLGPSDPSNDQLPSNSLVDHPGGAAIYFQEPVGTGPRELVNECTGTVAGGDATEIPERDSNGTSGLPLGGGTIPALADDVIDGQPCEEGSVTSKRGASVGSRRRPLDAPRANAMSDDGKRIFFLSPDPETVLPASLLGSSGASPCADLSGSFATPVENVGTASECQPQLYVRQKDSAGEAALRWISRSEVPGQSVQLLGRGVAFEGASDDGRAVYFRTNAPLTPDDPNGTGAPGPVTSGTASDNSWDLYRYELPADVDDDPATGTLTRISGGPSGLEDPNVGCVADIDDSCVGGTPGEAGGGTSARYISDDGKRVYFVTVSPIAGAVNAPPSGSATSPGGTSTVNSGLRNLYLYDADKTGADRWRFVARIPHSSNTTGNDTQIDACASATYSTGTSRDFNTSAGLGWSNGSCVRGTGDGGTLAFMTTGKLTEDDDDQAGDIYVYNADADELTRASAPPAGQSAYPCGNDQFCNADLGWTDPEGLTASNGRIGLDGLRHANLGEDGSLFFESRLELVSGDVNGTHYDTYKWKDGRLSLISPGNSEDHAFYSGNSRDGQDVFFWTSQRIDPREVEDADFDVYDARVGGGFPPPPPPPGDGCSPLQDVCQGAGGTRVDAGEQSSGAGGGGNASPRARADVTVSAPGAKGRRLAARTGVVKLGVRTATAGKVSAVARAKMRSRKGKRISRTVARGSARSSGARTMTVRLRLNGLAMRQLRAGRKLSLQVKVKQSGARTRTVSFGLRRAGR